ncbi:MAG TPA: acyltransferase [Mycobacteriales bacterium]|nr:acyltransferase [Mycobacteriales bacterium]
MTAAATREASHETIGRGRNHNLDALRGVAVLLVVLGHAVLMSRPNPTIVTTDPEDVLTYVGASGVYLFFALSGYVITKPFVDALLRGEPLPSVRAYATRRVFRIIPAYWLAFTFVIFDNPGPLPSGPVLLVHYLLMHNLWPGQEQAIYFSSWTLTLEALFYILVPVAAVALRALRPRAIDPQRFIVGLVLVGLLSALWKVGATQVSGTDGVWLGRVLPAQLFLFVPGIVAAATTHPLRSAGFRRALVTGPSRGPVRMLPFTLAGVVLGATCMNLLPLSVAHRDVIYATNEVWYAIGYGALLLAAVHTEQWEHGLARFLAWFGVISYSLYLVHTALIRDLFRLAPHIPGGDSHYLVGAAMMLIASVPLARIMWAVVERPTQQLGAKLGRRFTTTTR